jgi:hypothetical protein
MRILFAEAMECCYDSYTSCNVCGGCEVLGTSVGIADISYDALVLGLYQALFVHEELAKCGPVRYSRLSTRICCDGRLKPAVVGLDSNALERFFRSWYEELFESSMQQQYTDWFFAEVRPAWSRDSLTFEELVVSLVHRWNEWRELSFTGPRERLDGDSLRKVDLVLTGDMAVSSLMDLRIS